MCVGVRRSISFFVDKQVPTWAVCSAKSSTKQACLATKCCLNGKTMHYVNYAMSTDCFKLADSDITVDNVQVLEDDDSVTVDASNVIVANSPEDIIIETNRFNPP